MNQVDLLDAKTTDTVSIPLPTRRGPATISSRRTSHPSARLYAVKQGLDEYYVVASSDDEVLNVAAQRLLEHPDRCSWPPEVYEVIR